MEIKCWGSRGSIPVSGSRFIKYGGDTTCIEISANSGETIIVDAGTGIRPLGFSFIDRDITSYYLLFTHVHWDHVLGFPFFRPLLYSPVKLTIQDSKFSGIPIKDVLKQVMKSPFFPISIQDLSADLQFDKSLNGTFHIGSIKVESINTSHKDGGKGYRFTEDDKSFVFLTDNELGFDHPGRAEFDEYVDFARDADVLFHDGEYTLREYKRKEGWGHSSIDEVIDLALQANVKKLGLFHLNQDRSDKDMDRIVDRYAAKLKNKKLSLDFFAVPCRYKIRL